MGCDLSRIYHIEIRLENELAVFEPRDDVAGCVIIRADEDTAIDSCSLLLYGLAKTRWTSKTETKDPNHLGSLIGGINPTRSNTNLSNITDGNLLDHLRNNAVTFLTTISDGLRNEVRQFDALRRSIHCEKLCRSRLDCPTRCSLSPPIDRISHGSIQRDNNSKCSWTSVTDTLVASLDNATHSNGNPNPTESVCGSTCSTSSVKSLSIEYSPNRPTETQSSVACSACETCLPNRSKLLGARWKSLVDIHARDPVPLGDVRLIYRARVNLLANRQSQSHEKTTRGTPDSNYSDSNETATGSERASQLATPDSTGSGLPMKTVGGQNGGVASEQQQQQQQQPYILTRGTHKFDFEFQLPADLPSSFDLPSECLVGGATARLHYGLRIEICNKAAQIRHTQQREIILFRPLELTHFPRLRERVTLHKEFAITGCCVSPVGSILCDLTVNKTGFVPGESITPRIHVTNRSSRAIQTVHLTFAQTVTLRSRDNRSHTEVLRLFASRLKPRSPSSLETTVNRSAEEDPSLFSSSMSPSSHASLSKSDRSKTYMQQAWRSTMMAAGGRLKSSTTNGSAAAAAAAAAVGLRRSAATGVAVAPHGASACFEDVIHVPPLPATGLVGRQNLIHVDYILILRLRLQDDSEGKHDRKMQIPITIGSDPTRETSFIGCHEVVPCYASFNYASGEVTEYNPNRPIQAQSCADQKHVRLNPVYRYFKPRAVRKHDSNKQQNKAKPSLDCHAPRLKSSISGPLRRNYLNRSLQSYEGDRMEQQHLASINPNDAKFSQYLTVLTNCHADPETTSVEAGSTPARAPREHQHRISTETLTSASSSTGCCSESPPTPLLSRHQFYDDGDRVIIDDEYSVEGKPNGAGEQGKSVLFHCSTPQSDHLTTRGMGKSSEEWIHGSSGTDPIRRRRCQSPPQRQSSFEFYSDQTPSLEGEENDEEEGEDDTSEPCLGTHSPADERSNSDTTVYSDQCCVTGGRSLDDLKVVSVPDGLGNPLQSHSPMSKRWYASPEKRLSHWIPSSTPNFSLTRESRMEQSYGNQSYARAKADWLHHSCEVQNYKDNDNSSFGEYSSPDGQMQQNQSHHRGKNIHQASWNHPHVAPVPGRSPEREGTWTVGPSWSMELKSPISSSLQPTVVSKTGEHTLKINLSPVNKTQWRGIGSQNSCCSPEMAGNSLGRGNRMFRSNEVEGTIS